MVMMAMAMATKIKTTETATVTMAMVTLLAHTAIISQEMMITTATLRQTEIEEIAIVTIAIVAHAIEMGNATKSAATSVEQLLDKSQYRR